MKRKNKVLKEKDILIIEEMTEKGIPDCEIIKNTCYSKNQVFRVTTNYWKRKMNHKKLDV